MTHVWHESYFLLSSDGQSALLISFERENAFWLVTPFQISKIKDRAFSLVILNVGVCIPKRGRWRMRSQHVAARAQGFLNLILINSISFISSFIFQSTKSLHCNPPDQLLLFRLQWIACRCSRYLLFFNFSLLAELLFDKQLNRLDATLILSSNDFQRCF